MISYVSALIGLYAAVTSFQRFRAILPVRAQGPTQSVWVADCKCTRFTVYLTYSDTHADVTTLVKCRCGSWLAKRTLLQSAIGRSEIHQETGAS